jgi:hypothetical protein
MSCLGNSYNPVPPRAWNRVDSTCQYTNNNISNQIFVPFLNKTIPIEEYQYQLLMYNKGNVLQYKKNSSQLTKNQKYTQIAKGLWTIQTKNWATQGYTYSNPNTNSLQRINSTNIFLTTGLPTTLPITCDPATPIDQVVIENGGTLIYNTYENKCDGVLIPNPAKPGTPCCAPTSSSDVPGPIINLCWNNGNQTWFPKTRYTMNNSPGNKFPQGYKFLVSANGVPSVNA